MIKGIFMSIGWPATMGNVCSAVEAEENWLGRIGWLTDEDNEVAGLDALSESFEVSSNLSPKLLDIVVTLKDSKIRKCWHVIWSSLCDLFY